MLGASRLPIEPPSCTARLVVMHAPFPFRLLLASVLIASGCASEPDGVRWTPNDHPTPADGQSQDNGFETSGSSPASGGSSNAEQSTSESPPSGALTSQAGSGGAQGGGEVDDSCAAEPETVVSPDVLAGRLSRFLWQEEPDEALKAAVAAARSLEAVNELALSMLEDARARVGVAAFFSSWLRLGDLPSVSKESVELPQALVASMQKEAPALGVGIVLDGDARFETLMTASYTFMDGTLAQHYGVSGIVGSELQQVSFERPERIGILMSAGVLTRFSGGLNPPWAPRRYWLVEETLLCDRGGVPAPQANNFPRSEDYATIREDLEHQTSHRDCIVCHESINPVGLAFSAFDTLGRFNPVDEVGMPVRTAGTIPPGFAWDQELTIADAADMIRQFIKEPEVRRCFAARWLDYALTPSPRPEDREVRELRPELQCSLSQAHAAFEATDGNIRALIGAVAATPAFASR